MDSLFEKICFAFALKGKYIGNRIIKAGNINDTYVIVTRENEKTREYICQRVNHNVFKNPEMIAQNVEKVTSHIRKRIIADGGDSRRGVMCLYKTTDGEYFYINGSGDYWRVMSYIYDSVTYNGKPEVSVLRATGTAFGRFQRYLSDFPADELYETIPDFHNTPLRFSDLEKAAEKDIAGRRHLVTEELEYLLKNKDKAPFFADLYESGKIPLRVTHNDTKCNNVMFDKSTGDALAVIDLDTVMPGFAAYDFGDAVRYAANTVDEDDDNYFLASIDMNKYSAFARGYLYELGEILTDEEINSLSYGVLLITLELSARFLTDFLNGDTYFKTTKPDHNLIRTRTQIAFAKDLEKRMPEMEQIISSISSELSVMANNGMAKLT